jgi:hypothetical protein
VKSSNVFNETCAGHHPCDFADRMSGRRSHGRFSVLCSPEGVLRVVRDIVFQGTINDQILALSREPGVLGETVSLQFPELAPFEARVLESTPVIVDGSVRHQLRLHQVRPDGTMPGSIGTDDRDSGNV